MTAATDVHTATPGLTVRPATRADADGIRALDGLGSSTVNLLDADLEAPDRIVLVATRAADLDRVVGVALGMVAVDDGHVLDIAVAADARGAGIGGALLDVLLDALRQRGAIAATLEVRPGNVPARRLYAGRGFVEAGERPDYYPPRQPDGAREPALIMWHHDLGAA